MFQTLKEKFEAKRAVWAEETQQRIAQYAEQEQLSSLKSMNKEEQEQNFLNVEVEKYLKTVHPAFLLKPEVTKAIFNMLHARSEGTVSININMTKEMRKAYSFYHNELKVFLRLLERKGFCLEGNEEKFLTTIITKLREKNYHECLEQYGDFLPENATIVEAFECYLETVEKERKYDCGKLDFFTSYLNQKGIAGITWSPAKLKRKLKQFERMNKDEFKMKQLEKRLEKIS
ncbi:hypothetical protein LGQ02_16135 [Bacillus shivajii]|uniref:hypothetical protein n=1 Tax=Bacillus shivajii TaxID=1983719 RepID=UPI001CFC21FC|nr:hypothetical protein [Bacillus shivajii]UCZ52358.1 hypothetical protein LGQ02_16135 [Bacillus shivajii]